MVVVAVGWLVVVGWVVVVRWFVVAGLVAEFGEAKL